LLFFNDLLKGVTTITKKILIIEDDPSFSRAINHIIEKEGYDVSTASNGMTGLRMIQENPPDLLILDVMLPGLDGFEICSRIRTDESMAKLPIIMLSAKGQETDKTTGLSVGANEYLTKPVDRTLLLEKITSLLAEG
jgi:DNA-binding response OmpR family regulator